MRKVSRNRRNNKSLECGKFLETGETTKSLEYGKCLETGETTKSLEFDRVTHAPSYNY